VAAISSERIESDDNALDPAAGILLRIMAVVSVAKGLYHWGRFTASSRRGRCLENQPMAGRPPRYFAVIELVAAVGLWLATPWAGGVADHRGIDGGDRTDVPGIYGGSLTVVAWKR